MEHLLPIGLNHYLTISAFLLGFGLFAVMTRKNAIVILMGVELILNAANINFLAFSKYNGGMGGGDVLSLCYCYRCSRSGHRPCHRHQYFQNIQERRCLQCRHHERVESLKRI